MIDKIFRLMEISNKHQGAVGLCWTDGSILECRVCRGTFTDPRMLPCMHTFCLKCLERTGAGKRPGEFITCPLCRMNIKIPGRGFTEFKPNTFVQKVNDFSGWNVMDHVDHSDEENNDNVEVEETMRSDSVAVGRKISLSDEIQTNAVQGVSPVTGGATQEASLLVVGHCIDCDQSFCQICFHAHGRIKVSKHHKVTDLNKEFPCEMCSPEDKIQTPTVVFCKECEQILCDGCFKTHKKLKVTKDHHLVDFNMTCDACSETDEVDETEVKSEDVCTYF